MAMARRVVELGRRARTESRVRTRQPLASVTVAGADATALTPLLDVVAEELNVREVLISASVPSGRARVKPDFRALGPRLGARVKDLATALSRDDGTVAASLAAGTSVVVETSSGPIEVGPGDVEIVRDDDAVAGTATDGTITVMLDLRIDDALRAEGLAREVIREVQDARKANGLEVSDRIALWLDTDDPGVRAAIGAHADLIADEVLATRLTDEAPDGASVSEVRVEGSAVRIALART